MRKLLIAILVMSIIVFCLVGVMLYKSAKLMESRDSYKERLEISEISALEKDRQITELKHKITGLDQKVEQLTIKYTADEMYIEEVNKRYRSLYLYASMAEWILIENGIEYRMTEERFVK